MTGKENLPQVPCSGPTVEREKILDAVLRRAHAQDPEAKPRARASAPDGAQLPLQASDRNVSPLAGTKRLATSAPAGEPARAPALRTSVEVVAISSDSEGLVSAVLTLAATESDPFHGSTSGGVAAAASGSTAIVGGPDTASGVVAAGTRPAGGAAVANISGSAVGATCVAVAAGDVPSKKAAQRSIREFFSGIPGSSAASLPSTPALMTSVEAIIGGTNAAAALEPKFRQLGEHWAANGSEPFLSPEFGGNAFGEDTSTALAAYFQAAGLDAGHDIFTTTPCTGRSVNSAGFPPLGSLPVQEREARGGSAYAMHLEFAPRAGLVITTATETAVEASSVDKVRASFLKAACRQAIQDGRTSLSTWYVGETEQTIGARTNQERCNSPRQAVGDFIEALTKAGHPPKITVLAACSYVKLCEATRLFNANVPAGRQRTTCDMRRLIEAVVCSLLGCQFYQGGMNGGNTSGDHHACINAAITAAISVTAEKMYPDLPKKEAKAKAKQLPARNALQAIPRTAGLQALLAQLSSVHADVPASDQTLEWLQSLIQSWNGLRSVELAGQDGRPTMEERGAANHKTYLPPGWGHGSNGGRPSVRLQESVDGKRRTVKEFAYGTHNKNGKVHEKRPTLQDAIDAAWEYVDER